ncbi:MAG TPA: SOS response-associated peptidase [Myxococcota bacterium]|nr:SOS response-associated peptidase [Myxococcota bacterium]
MCGRFFLSTSGAEIARHFGLVAAPDLVPRFNIAPGQDVPVVRALGRDDGRVLELRRWGLVPGGIEDPSRGPRPINARAETAASLPIFRDALARRRGLVPADGFYEWQHRGRSARPFAVRIRGGALFAMAAVWDRWERGGAAVPGAPAAIDSVAILTTEANARIRTIHDRMPLILAPEDWARWLDPEARVAPLLRPCPAEWIDLHPVATRVNDVREDDARLVEPERDLFGPTAVPPARE